ncbi:hypothetical protein LIER_05773 [Lithospermum erythrorhizon]|uniref:Uncharacterized protein n=1 Tax=Lithospermum erythrorhizon TaxID=34254 RepID=A0AAV3P1Y1_LITER
MDAETGEILWSTAVPKCRNKSCHYRQWRIICRPNIFHRTYICSRLAADTGNILWSKETGATVYGGMSVSKGCIYVGHGYKVSGGAFTPSFTAGTSVLAFCIEEIL